MAEYEENGPAITFHIVPKGAGCSDGAYVVYRASPGDLREGSHEARRLTDLLQVRWNLNYYCVSHLDHFVKTGGFLIAGVLWGILIAGAPSTQAAGFPLAPEAAVTARDDTSLYSGPDSGEVSGGQTIDTRDVQGVQKRKAPGEPTAIPENEFELKPTPESVKSPLPPGHTRYIEDRSGKAKQMQSEKIIQDRQNFDGIGYTGFIPPDPIIATGPTHNVVCVNTDFAIYKKDGTHVKTINASGWFENVLPERYTAFDPQVIYDHFADRFVMVWLAVDGSAKEAWYLVSVSDDSNPEGTWYNYALPSDVNGSTEVDNWGDYEGLGFNKHALYITSNQFGFASGDGFHYVKLRVLGKSQFYNNETGAVEWLDFWNLQEPGDSTKVFTVRPSVTFGEDSTEYFLNASPYKKGTFFTRWKLEDPLGSPALSAKNISTAAYYYPPGAEQKGSIETIDVGGSRLRDVVFRNDKLWTVHSIAPSSEQESARLHYVGIDAANDTVFVDNIYGKNDFYYYYPAMAVDSAGASYVVFNRSSGDTYAGIRYTGMETEEDILKSSASLKKGENSYHVEDSFGRNRWGDYSGAAVDPADPRSVWVYAEYASDIEDRWATRIGQLEMVEVKPPLTPIATSPQLIRDTFTTRVEVGSDTSQVSDLFSLSYCLSYGNENLQVTDHKQGSFLGSGASYTTEVNPDSTEICTEISRQEGSGGVDGAGVVATVDFKVDTSLSSEQLADFRFRQVDARKSDSSSVTLDSRSKSIDLIPELLVWPGDTDNDGEVDQSDVLPIGIYWDHEGPARDSISSRWESKAALPWDTLKATYADADGSGRVNQDDVLSIGLNWGKSRDAKNKVMHSEPSLANYRETDNRGYLDVSKEVVDQDRSRYKLKVRARDWSNILGASFELDYPSELMDVEEIERTGWMGEDPIVHTEWKKQSGTIQMGISRKSGDGPKNNSGILAEVIYKAEEESKSDVAGEIRLRKVLLSTGNAGYVRITDIKTTAVQRSESDVPEEYALEKNYPNPFNPSTTIRFSLPEKSKVELTVFNVLGKQVASPVDKTMQAGRHQVTFNASGLSSGIYIYKIEAGHFSKIRKMVVVK